MDTATSPSRAGRNFRPLRRVLLAAVAGTAWLTLSGTAAHADGACTFQSPAADAAETSSAAGCADDSGFPASSLDGAPVALDAGTAPAGQWAASAVPGPGESTSDAGNDADHATDAAARPSWMSQLNLPRLPLTQPPRVRTRGRPPRILRLRLLCRRHRMHHSPRRTTPRPQPNRGLPLPRQQWAPAGFRGRPRAVPRCPANPRPPTPALRCPANPRPPTPALRYPANPRPQTPARSATRRTHDPRPRPRSQW